MKLATKLALFGALFAAFFVSVPEASASPSLTVAAIVAPVQDTFKETEMKIDPPTSAAVKKVFKVEFDGLFWYEAEDADGNRYWINVITEGYHKRGVAFFGNPSRRHFVKFH